MAIVKQCDRCGKIYNHYPDPDEYGTFIKMEEDND